MRKSGDGRAIVFHDAELARLTGQSGLLCDHSVGEITGIRLSGSEDVIPTLRDTLDQIDGQVPLLIEIKIDRDRSVSPLCRAVRRDLEGYRGHVAVMSFDPRVAVWFRNHGGGTQYGMVLTESGARTFSGRVKQWLSIRSARPQFLACDVRDLPNRISRAQMARGAPLLSWTVRNAATLETALQAGATPIMEGAGVEAWRSRT